MDVKHITTKSDFDEMCAKIKTEKLIGLDTETALSGNPPQLSLIQISTTDLNWIADVLAIEDISAIKDILEDKSILKIIHYAPFERNVFSAYNFVINNVYDTCSESRRIMGKVDGGHNLKAVCKRELDIDMDKQYQVSDWLVRPLSSEQLKYAALDSYVLPKLYEIFLKADVKAPF
jgi:ribonuclease D